MNRYVSLLLILAIHSVVAQTKYHITEYTTANGLPTNVIHDIVQDGLGFIWLSTNFNVVRFDGYQFRNYDIEGIRQHNLPPDLYVDQYGELWVSFLDNVNNHPFYKYNRNTAGFVRYEPSLTKPAQHLVQDKEGRIWLGHGSSITGNGLSEFNPDTGETINYPLEDEDSVRQVRKNLIHSIEDRDCCLYLITENGLWQFDKSSKNFSRPPINPKDTAIVFSSSFLYRVHQGSGVPRKWALAHSQDGSYLIRIDPNFNIISKFDAPSDWLGADVDNQDIFWGRTREGIYRHDFEKGSGELIVKGRDVAAFMIDRDNNLWVAGVGLTRYTRFDLPYQVTPIKDFPQDAIWSSISTVKGANGSENFAISGGATSYNAIWTALIHPDSCEVKRIELPDDLVKGNWFTKSYAGTNHLWVAALGSGTLGIPLDKNSGLLSSKDILRLEPNISNFKLGLSLCVYEDTSNHLWVGTYGDGLSKIDLSLPHGDGSSIKQFRNVPGDTSSLTHNNVILIFPLDSTGLLIGTHNGVDLFKDGKFKHVIRDKTGFYFLKTRSDGLFVSTSDGLYYSDKTRHYSHFEKVIDGIKGAILEDEENRIWILTPNGLEVYEPSTGVTISFSDNLDLKVFNEFSPSFAKTSSQLFGLVTKVGLVTFNPSEFRISRRGTYPILSALTINNKSIAGNRPGHGESFSLKSDITVLNELVIDHQHNNFSIGFSAMEMIAPERNLYRYKLEGYDEDWIEADYNDRKASYTNLDAGTYTFRVKASNHHGVWSGQERTLRVIVLPPPWKTWWAYSLYALAAIGIFLFWRNYDIKRVKLKHRAEHLSELDTLKTRFFANISHEFRTPITLIMGPLKEMYNGTFKGDQKSALGVMMRNGQRLLQLINQLLDLSKLEAGKMQLHASEVDLVLLLREITSSYESLAVSKNLKYIFYPEVHQLLISIDQEKVEKVVHNLLSNAFKFTMDGEIVIYVKVQDREAVIEVKDTGIGIPEDQTDKVFDRFYQVDNSQTRSYEGSGIGMALARELIELHQGKISVVSKEGFGTTFTVRLPLSKERSAKTEVVGRKPIKSEEYSDVLFSDEKNTVVIDSLDTVTSEQPVLLVVEDNTDMRNYISKILSDHYHIGEAINGKDGVKKAEEIVPDLIISDVMMPEMDGYKLCELIKSNELTSHIPVILLTARADRESKLQGLETGADDYLAKPFDADELKLIVRNRIEERRKMRERFSREITLEPRQVAITSLDEKFLTKVLAVIEEHMDDEHFSIDELSREVGYSNMHFYRKIKALAGETPSQFLRTIRLKRAAELLRAKSDNVTQIAYSVGFSSLSYFNKCFKEQFGITPGQFAENRPDVKLSRIQRLND